MKKFTAWAFCFICLAAQISGEQEMSTGLLITPEAQIPVGGTAENYSLGLGGRIEALLGLPSFQYITPSIDSGFAYIPLDLGEGGFPSSSNLSLVRTGFGARSSLSLGERFTLFGRAYVSGFFAALNGDTSGNASGLAFGGGGGLGFLLSPKVKMELSGGYDQYRDLYEGLSFSLGTTVRLTGPGNDAIPRRDFVSAGAGPLEGYIRFSSVKLNRVFPVLYKYYDDHPIGTATVMNTGSHTVEEAEIRLKLNQFMDAPKLSARIDTLEPGEQHTIDIYALFTEEILAETEGAKVAAELSAEYKVRGRSGTDMEVITLDTFNRNAMRWDDDRKIAAFVTARDDEVQRFARNNASIVDDRGVDAVARELQLAMVFLNAMHAHRCAYVVDPSSSYFELSRDNDAIDSIQFPRQTLQYRAGDCDDLSAAFAALLESAGVPTAFITVPGHIYVAFELDMTAREAGRTFSRYEDIIVREDSSIWVPVETTMLAEGFLAAWAEGAAQWRKHDAKGNAVLLPTRSAWKTYEPVAFGVSSFEIDIPQREKVAGAFHAELERFINREISGRERKLLGRLRMDPADIRSRNKLGVLYARYGKYQKAEEQFRAVADARPYLPAFINLGNIAFLNRNYRAAREAYGRALRLDADSRTALLGMARVAYAEEDYRGAEEAYAELSAQAPELAERFAYLASGGSGGARAADTGTVHSYVVWEEEE